MAVPEKYLSFYFGEFAAKYQFVNKEDVQYALVKQQELLKDGIKLLLGEVLQDLNLISQSACAFIEQLQGQQRESIEGYELLCPLGKGGVGSVFKAKQISLDRLVALKLVNVSNHHESTEILFKEARTIASFNHPNIVSAIDVGYQDGIIYLAMEFIDGPDLKNIYKEQGVFSEDECIEIGMRIGEALEYLQKFNCVHRDIKPGNILIDKNNQIKLIDLGLALDVSSVSDKGSTSKGVGTPNYISPEQAKGRLDLDVRSDIYSLGATLYYLSTGRNLFKGKDAREILLKHVKEIPESPCLHNPELSEEFAAILLDTLEKEPSERPTPAEFVERLQFLRDGSDAPSVVKAKKPSRLRNRRAPRASGGGRRRRTRRLSRR